MATLISCSLRVLRSKRFVCTLLYSSQPKEASKRDIAKVINVAIIGAPNSGKSTLINRIVERKICAASNKVHTTTKLARAMCYQNDTQIIFLDTPGVVTDKEKKRFKLPDSMLSACEKSLRCADVIGVVHDISNPWTKNFIHCDLITMLTLVENIPAFLIVNKVDQLKSKKELLSIIRNLTNGCVAGIPMPGSEKKSKGPEVGYSKFSDVFIVSALEGDGVSDIKDYLVSNAKVSGLQYSPDNWTDQSPETLIIQAVRAKFLDFLAQEIPYNLKVQMEYYEEVEFQDKIVCSVIVECANERLMRLISGAGGGRLQQIKSGIKNDLVDIFKKTIMFDIRITVKGKPVEEIMKDV